MSREARCDIPRLEEITNVSFKNAYKPGDMNKMFEDLAKLEGTETIMHPPEGPWILRFNDVISEEETDTLLNLTLAKVKRSTDQGEFDEFGVQAQVTSKHRTSSNAWCDNGCWDNPTMKNFTERIAKMVRVPPEYFESFQVLKYEIGQEYKVHHDSSDDEAYDASGPRILTFFIYLSDVEEGGETQFDKLNIKVKPKRGSAILWPSTLNDSPWLVDKRTTHAALPVKKGIKLATNLWIHLR